LIAFDHEKTFRDLGYRIIVKKILLILICLIFTSGLALAEHGTKKGKGYNAAGPKKTIFGEKFKI